MATVKYPIKFALHPIRLPKGRGWVWLDLENIGEDPITRLTVRLISEDASQITVQEPDNYVPSLPPGEKQEIGFEIEAHSSTAAYVSIAGERDGAPFRWESPYIKLQVGENVAEVASLVALGPRYPPVDEPVQLEALVRTFAGLEDLRLAIWVDTPAGAFDKLAEFKSLDLQPGETSRYSASFTPQEKGIHTIYAYLHRAQERIDRRMERVYVS